MNHHESILIEPHTQTLHSNQVKVTIETETIYEYDNLLLPINSSGNASNGLLTNRKDALLISILDRLQLDSYSVSVSDSSDNSISQLDLDTLLRGIIGGGSNRSTKITTNTNSTCNANAGHTTSSQCHINDDTSSSSSSSFKTFPVGTSIQYSNSKASRGSESVQQKGEEDVNTAAVIIDENKLLRLLSTNGLLCENVQMDDILRSNEPTSTSMSTSTHHDDSSGHKKNESRLIVIPNDAFTLCHSVSLYNMIISSSPCRDKLGILSKFHLSSLNEADVTNRAVWMSVHKYSGNDSNSNSNNSNKVSIKWGIRFKKQLYKSSVSLGDLMIDKKFPSHSKDSSSTNSNSNKNVYLEHCPMSSSSTIITRKSDNLMKEHNLQMGATSMGEELIQMDNDFGNNTKLRAMGIERHVLRRNGVAHFGTFQSRIYVDGSTDFCQKHNLSPTVGNKEEGDKGLVNVSVVDYYPNIVRPIFHSLKAFVVSGSNSDDNGTNRSTELNLFDLPGHSIELAADGSSSLSFSTTLLPNSSIYVEMDYEPLFLPFELFPADPNRGIDVKPSYATFTVTCPSQQQFVQQQAQTFSFELYSNALLIMPPVPDMSMPFNVISLCGTCFAILIGASINLVVKKSCQTVSDTLKGVEKKTPIQKMKEKLKLKVKKLKQKVAGKKVKREKDD